MKIRFANNLSFTLSVAKPVGTDYFTVSYAAGPPVVHTFGSKFPDGAGLAAENSAGLFAVPITLVSAAGVVKATGHVLRWNFNAGFENRVYLDYVLTQADAVPGDKLECRVQASHEAPGAASYFYSEGYLNSAVTYNLSNYGEYCHFDIDSAAVNFRPPDSSIPKLPNVSSDFSVNSLRGVVPLHYVLTLRDVYGNLPAFTVTGDGSDVISWESGVAPSFATGLGTVFIELWLVTTYKWVGRWFRVAS